MRLLADAGADVDAVDGKGRRLLSVAVGMENADAARVPSAAGADPNGSDGRTPLRTVVGKGAPGGRGCYRRRGPM